jgi:hypothetical protein
MSVEPRTASSPNQRKPGALPRHLERNLLAYAAAAGTGLISFAQPALAEIVYTPSNIRMAEAFDGGGPALTPFDIDNDGVTDFVFTNFSYSSHGLGGASLTITPNQASNEVVGVLVTGQKRVTAAALPAGVEVGSHANFQAGPIKMAVVDHSTQTAFASGSWLTVEFGYLGLKFVVNGEVHYGWARIKLVGPGAYGAGNISGYAYESVANQPIITGQTSGTASSQAGSVRSNSDPRTLGTLAAGAPAMAAGRDR